MKKGFLGIFLLSALVVGLPACHHGKEKEKPAKVRPTKKKKRATEKRGKKKAKKTKDRKQGKKKKVKKRNKYAAYDDYKAYKEEVLI